jgi:3-oxoacyl-[acyl-carrier protein] reductase
VTDRPRTALVTGCNGDVGRFLAAHLLAGGWRVLGLDRADREPAPGVIFERCDLRDAAATAAVIERWANEHGAPDLVVNGAGIIANAPLVTLTAAGGWQAHDPALWEDVIGSSLTAAFHVTAATVPQMLAGRRKGVIVNISSVCAAGNPGQVAYSAAKAGLNGLTYALAKELGPLGIRVVGLAPGYLDTSSTRDNVTPARLAKVVGGVPLRRLGSLEDLAGAIDFIVANGYVTGTIIELDGGLVL